MGEMSEFWEEMRTEICLKEERNLCHLPFVDQECECNTDYVLKL